MLNRFAFVLSAILLATSAHAQLDALEPAETTEEVLPWLKEAEEEAVEAAEEVEELVEEVAEEIEEIVDEMVPEPEPQPELVEVTDIGTYDDDEESLSLNKQAFKLAKANRDVVFTIRAYALGDGDDDAIEEAFEVATEARQKLIRKGIDKKRIKVFTLGDANKDVFEESDTDEFADITIAPPVTIEVYPEN